MFLSMNLLWEPFLLTHAETYEHCVRLANTAQQLADFMKMDKPDKDHLVMGCFLHDLGKGAIPAQLLEKKEKLTSEEWRLIKRHPIEGMHMARDKDVDDTVLDIILFHHERWDGTGYPYGLTGTKAPPLARICAILDAFDSMMHDRPFRSRLGLQAALQELRNGSSSQFDWNYVDVFTRWAETEWRELSKVEG